MKALTIRQPWASLLAHGIKRYESRTWATSYRGPLLIHAGLGRVSIDPQSPLDRFLATALPSESLPRGAFIAIADLVAIHRADSIAPFWPEELLSNFQPGGYLWEVAHPRLLARPLPARGALSLWTPALDVHTALDLA